MHFRIFRVCCDEFPSMNSDIQTIAALVVVAVAATWLVRLAIAKRRNPGCGGGCGCAADDFKAKLKR